MLVDTETKTDDGLDNANGPRMTLWKVASTVYKPRHPFDVIAVIAIAEVQQVSRDDGPHWKVKTVPFEKECRGVIAVGVVGVPEIDPYPVAWKHVASVDFKPDDVLSVYFPVES